MPRQVTILGIESSCDETGVAVCRDGRILSNVVATQEVHRRYGGVVPELASRAHLQHIVPVMREAMDRSGLSLAELDAVAFTEAPGLIGALLVGSGFAKSLALALRRPLVAVHHMQAHVLSNLIGEARPAFPFLCLTVSGGHTQIVLCRSPLDMEVLGETLDDAAGEAFDKSAKLLGLPYPGGPLIDRHAVNGDPHRFTFAEPQIPGLDFSFSGVKTSILYFLQERVRKEPDFIRENLDDLCASIQHRIVGILLRKLRIAALETGIRDLCLAGGVAANRGLRSAFAALCTELRARGFTPALPYCTDNAAMIALTGYHRFLAGQVSDLSATATARSGW
jgi:N6-L-threonylcarbamoyladenine synthase